MCSGQSHLCLPTGLVVEAKCLVVVSCLFVFGIRVSQNHVFFFFCLFFFFYMAGKECNSVNLPCFIANFINLQGLQAVQEIQ